MTYSGVDAARALGRPNRAASHRWAARLGLRPVGSGHRLSFTLGQVIVARGLRDWLSNSGGRNTENQRIGRLLCTHGSHLIDLADPDLPRFVIVSGTSVRTGTAEDAVASLSPGSPVHLIDIHAAVRQLSAEGVIRREVVGRGSLTRDRVTT